jgi:hypothetical protein
MKVMVLSDLASICKNRGSLLCPPALIKNLAETYQIMC